MNEKEKITVDKAGCILLNKDKNKVALIYRNYRNDYSFPKGHVEKGESLIECAIRETEEEIKRKVKLVNDKELCFEKYSCSEGEVCVHYYLGIDDGVSDNNSFDYHDLMWCDINFVSDKLTYETTKKMFNDIIDKLC